MKKYPLTNSGKALKLLALFGFGLLFQPLVKADVVVLQNGQVITGKVLQQDSNGVLIQMEYGTFRYPLSLISDVKKEAAAAPHVSNNGQRIPDWAQIVTLLANNGWAQELKQVPATVINSGIWRNVPYISFRCAFGGYEINIFGDLNNPAAIQVGAMNYLKQSADAKSNCVAFICSVLPSADDRKMVRALNLNQQDVQKKAGMTFATIQPDDPASFGGWWVSVYNESELASAQASETELMAITQPRAAAAQPVAATAQPAATATIAVAQPGAPAQQPAAATAQPAATTAQPAPTTYQPVVATTYYGATPAWTAEELATARPAAAAAYASGTTERTAGTTERPSSTAGMVYPRSYTRTGGAYGHAAPRR